MSRLFVAANNDHISDLTTSPLTDDFYTFSVWFKTDNGALNQHLLQVQDKDVEDNRSGLFFFGSSDQKIHAYSISSAASAAAISTATISADSTWHHACAVYNGDGLRVNWLDGAPVAERTLVNPIGFDSFAIGRGMQLTNVESFSGNLAEVAVWNTPLMENEVLHLYAGAKPTRINSDNLAVYAPFDTTSIADQIGTLTLTASGTSFSSDHPTIYDIDPPYQISAVDVSHASANLTDNDGDFSDVVAASRTGMLSLWVYYDQADGSQGFAAFQGTTGFNADFWFGTTSSHRFAWENTPTVGQGDFLQWFSDATLSTGWHHILLSFNLAAPVTIQLAVDDVISTGFFTSSAPTDSIVNWDDIDLFATLYAAIGLGPTNDFRGCVADFWLHHSANLDISDVANRRKFIDAYGRPVFLGYQGELPSGSAPIMFLRGDFTCYYQNFSGVGPAFGWPTSTVGGQCVEVSPSAPIPLLGSAACDGGPHTESIPFDLVLTVTNINLEAVTDIDIAVSLPSGITVADDGATANDLSGTVTANPGESTITLTGGSLGVAASGSLTVSVVAEGFGMFTIGFTMTSSFGDSLAEDITSTECQVNESDDTFVLHCIEHKFVYRPDARIYPLAHTHCPKGGEPLRSWRHKMDEEEDTEYNDFGPEYPPY